MTWIAVPVPKEEITAERLYEIGRRHKLVLSNTDMAIDNYRHVCQECVMVSIQDDQDEKEVAVLVISDIVEDEEASVDLILVAKYFSPIDKNGDPNKEPFNENLAAVLAPIFERLLEGRNLRRLNALVPKSRSRTFKALRECGFVKEGVKRDGIRFASGGLEDLVTMGMLPPKE